MSIYWLTADNLILFRLLATKGETLPEPALKKTLYPLLAKQFSLEDWAVFLRAALPRAEQNGQIEHCGDGLCLTENGRLDALLLLGLEQMPAPLEWDALQTDYLVPRALHLPLPTPQELAQVRSPQGLCAMVLKQSFKLSGLPAFPGLSAVGQALAWHLLGKLVGHTLPLQQESINPEVMAVLLQNAMPKSQWGDALPSPEQLLEQLAAHQVGIDIGSSADELRLAILRRRLASDLHLQAMAHFNLAQFAERVLQTANQCLTGRFGRHHIFIHHIWQAYREAYAPDFDFTAFQQLLLRAAHRELLYLERADSFAALNPRDVHSSETRDSYTVYHFIVV